MEFSIALVVVAAFLFITGVAGSGASVKGPGGIGFTFQGKVGPIPRAVFVCVSAAVALAAAATFVLALQHTAASPDSPSTPVVNSAAGSGNSSPSGSGAGSGAKAATGSSNPGNNTGNGSGASANSGSPTAGKTPVTDATVDLVVGIRPTLGQVSEDMKLLIDGRTAASWHADQQQPSKTIELTLKPGQHSYQLQGTYSYLYAGTIMQQEYSGDGTIAVQDGASYGINYSPPNQFQLVRTS